MHGRGDLGVPLSVASPARAQIMGAAVGTWGGVWPVTALRRRHERPGGGRGPLADRRGRVARLRHAVAHLGGRPALACCPRSVPPVMGMGEAWARGDTGMAPHNRKAPYKGLMAPLTERKRRDNTPYVVPWPHETKSAALTWPKNGPLPPRSIRISPEDLITLRYVPTRGVVARGAARAGRPGASGGAQA